MMRVLLTGADGYLGWPSLLKLSKAFPGDRIIGVDNFGRRMWVEEIGSVSAIPVFSMEERLEAAFESGYRNISFIEGDLSDYSFVKDLINIYKPEVVVHTAAQPSAPYSHLDSEKCAYTQDNNIAMTRNLLWALKEKGLLDTHFIETTTTGIYGAPNFDIPEGSIRAEGADGNVDLVPYPNMASSWYHVSKGFNATNMQLMNFQTGMPITDIRTSIIYGADTAETLENKVFATRFDFDFYFGTLFNRWCVMAVLEQPLSIYGTGNQIKPFIHIEDAARSIVDAVRLEKTKELRVFNQLTEYTRIKDLAQSIVDFMKDNHHDAQVDFIPNPRIEKEGNEYRFRNEKFINMLTGEPRTMKESVGPVLNALMANKDRISGYKDLLTA